MDHTNRKFNCNVNNTGRRLPVRSLYYNMDPQSRETTNGNDKPQQQKSPIYKWWKICLRHSIKTLSTKQNMQPTHSAWSIYKSHNLNTQSTCPWNHTEKNKKAAKIMIWERCSKIEKTMKGWRKNLAENKKKLWKRTLFTYRKGLQYTSIPQ